MTQARALVVPSLALLTAAASCVSGIDSEPRGDSGTGLDASVSGSGGSSGSSQTGGSSGTGGTSGQAGKGGVAGSGGTSASDASSAGTSSTGGTSAGDASLPAVRKSAGCGKLAPKTGDLSMTIDGNAASYFVTLPKTYDANTAYPLGFGFHGRARTHTDCKNGDCAGFAQVMQEKAALVYMKSLGGDGWEGAGERELNVEFFSAVLAELRASYCVDENRMFVAGTSSGAHFTNILACRFGNVLRAVAPVAGWMAEKQNCKGHPAALVIHGVDDPHVLFSAGVEAREFYRTSDGCSAVTAPVIADLHARVVANRESHECAKYQSCTSAPVTWCEHSEGGYDGSTHGWPKFGGQAIWDFVSGLR